MGNEQSVGGQAVPDTGLRLSTLCQYHAETGEGFVYVDVGLTTTAAAAAFTQGSNG